MPTRTILVVLMISLLTASHLESRESKTFPDTIQFKYKNSLLVTLAKQVPTILKNCDPETGRFGTGIWICTDQNRMFPIAVAYAYKSDNNPYYKDKTLLDVIIKSGDALIDNMDEKGQWEFRKKDGSTWGKIWMPWIYSRWIRSFDLIRDDMPPDRRETWTKALTLGYTGISETQLKKVHNIPTHHAMGLYIAGKALNHPEWCAQASDFMMKVIGEQSEGGYWSENIGPVVGYNFVYLDALGTYYSMSGDQRVLPTLEKGTQFHWHFRYPNGNRVETIDERNPYHEGIDVGNVGFTFTKAGRQYLQSQWIKYAVSKMSPESVKSIRDGSQNVYGYQSQLLAHAYKELPADLIASLLLYGEEEEVASVSSKDDPLFVLRENEKDCAATMQNNGWFICLSAYTAPIPNSRWIQDRQNLVSIFHDRTDLILGGGNTKLQPAWSNFTVGDMALLQHKEGDTDPDFLPKGELYHVPSQAQLIRGSEFGLDSTYGPEQCSIRVKPINFRTLEYQITSNSASDLPVNAHLTLIPHLDKPLETKAGQKFNLDETSIHLSSEEIGGSISHAGYRILNLPESTTLHWPALPHNPYRKDGHSTPAEARIEIRIPFDKNHSEYTLTLEIL
ncbi:MAG: hypothetical protein ABIH23_26835 [bacterium]